MRKWIIYVLIGFLTAGIASATWAEESDQKPAGKPAVQRPGRGAPGGQQKRQKLSEEKRAKMKEMKADREALKDLAESARNEVDPVKKAALIDELRAKVTEGSDRMHAEFSKRLEKAEEGVAKMKERLAEAEKNKGQKIEEHVQQLLSGERPQRPKGLKGKGPQGGPRGKGAKKPPVE